MSNNIVAIYLGIFQSLFDDIIYIFDDIKFKN